VSVGFEGLGEGGLYIPRVKSSIVFVAESNETLQQHFNFELCSILPERNHR